MNKAIIQAIFYHKLFFLSTIDAISVVFNILSSHANTNSPKRHLLHEIFLK